MMCIAKPYVNVNDNDNCFKVCGKMNINNDVNSSQKWGSYMIRDWTMERREKARNFREYKVWQDAVDYATFVYKVTSQLPWFEKKGLCDQLQRAVVSISSNIAEGAGRPSDADFAHFLDMSMGSANEVETQLLIAKNLEYISGDQFVLLRDKLFEIQKQLSGLIAVIRKSS